jgi:DNA-binding NarL/FixJ family response regulator
LIDQHSGMPNRAAADRLSAVPAISRDRGPAPLLAALIVDNSAYDVGLVVGALEDAGYRRLHWRRVEDAAGMRIALAEETWDVVISEERMPAFDSRSALAVLRDSGAEVPLVVFSGKVAEGTAMAALRAGAAELVGNDRFDRLGSAVAVCLRHNGKECQRWGPSEAEVYGSQNRLRALVETVIDPCVLLSPLRDKQGEVVEFVYEFANRCACEVSVLAREELVGSGMLGRVMQLAPAGLFDAYGPSLRPASG